MFLSFFCFVFPLSYSFETCNKTLKISFAFKLAWYTLKGSPSGRTLTQQQQLSDWFGIMLNVICHMAIITYLSDLSEKDIRNIDPMLKI